MNAAFTNGPVNKPADSSSADEDTLREETPLRILGSYKYPIVIATVINKEVYRLLNTDYSPPHFFN